MSDEYSDIAAIVEHENAFWEQVFQAELKNSGANQPAFSSVWWKKYYAEIARFVQGLLGEYRDPTILEAGSGSGKASIILGKDIRRTFLDIAPAALEYAQHLAKLFEATHIDFVTGNIFSMPFKDGQFTFVWNIGVLEHYPPDQVVALLQEMIRVTGRNGRLAFGVPNFLSGPILKARLLTFPLFAWIPGYRLESERKYTAVELQRLLVLAAKQAGREVSEVSVRHFGGFLPMETPGWILNTLGTVIDRVFPRSKFLLFISCQVH